MRNHSPARKGRSARSMRAIVLAVLRRPFITRPRRPRAAPSRRSAVRLLLGPGSRPADRPRKPRSPPRVAPSASGEWEQARHRRAANRPSPMSAAATQMSHGSTLGAGSAREPRAWAGAAAERAEARRASTHGRGASEVHRAREGEWRSDQLAPTAPPHAVPTRARPWPSRTAPAHRALAPSRGTPQSRPAVSSAATTEPPLAAAKPVDRGDGVRVVGLELHDVRAHAGALQQVGHLCSCAGAVVGDGVGAVTQQHDAPVALGAQRRDGAPHAGVEAGVPAGSQSVDHALDGGPVERRAPGPHLRWWRRW